MTKHFEVDIFMELGFLPLIRKPDEHFTTLGPLLVFLNAITMFLHLFIFLILNNNKIAQGSDFSEMVLQ